MNKDIIIVGAFHEMIELCEDCGFHIVGLVDNKYQGEFYGYPVIGTDSDCVMLHERYTDCDIVITPDSPRIRNKLRCIYSEAGFRFVTVISPKANVSRSATIGKGTVIQAGANISAGARIGEFVKLNTNANVMHDTIVGDYATIAPNAVLLGYVNIGKSAYIGANSTILPHIVVGSESTVGAGAVVTKNVDKNLIVAGVPARDLKKP